MDTSDFEDDMKHPRSIIHLDIDCFYAQVEMARHPEFAGKPLGVQQKQIVVTSNYAARRYGIKKCMLVEEAMRLCPGLILVRGEDLTNYRRASTKISEILLEYTPMVERLGLDESFVDVTTMVNDWKPTSPSLLDADTIENDEISRKKNCEPYGTIFGATDEDCPCGCHSRLRTAATIAAEMRERIYKQLGLTCSAGIGHNKLVAKLAGSLNKPNRQTLVYPWAGGALMSTVGSLAKIPGIGLKTLELLARNGLRTVDDVRRISLDDLDAKLGGELAKRLKENAEGIDDTAVKPSGKPQSIGLEDGFSNVSLVAEVESRLGALLRRLTELANEDGRIPVAMRITVRKNECTGRSTSKRETRQCALPQHLLPSTKFGPYDHAKMLALAMKLFHRAVDVTKPFHLTLLGVAFTKFEERISGRSSITSFLRKQVAVQSVLDISSESLGISDTSLGSPMSINQDSNDAADHETRSPTSQEFRSTTASSSSGVVGVAAAVGAHENFETIGDNENSLLLSPAAVAVANDDEEFSNEIEPSPKKTKLEVWLSGRRESPSNEMASLRLGPSSPMQLAQNHSPNDSNVLRTLPIDLPRDVENTWQTTKTKPNNILKYFIANK